MRHLLVLLQRLIAALPDAITAGVFLTAWLTPQRFGPEYVRNLTLVMAMEFIVIHSSVFYAVIASIDIARGKRIKWLLALSSLYVVIVLGFALEYKSTWPFAAFGWLLVSRFLHLWTLPTGSREAEGKRMVQLWAVSVVAYLAGAFMSALVELPPLGMDSRFISSMMQSGGTGWSAGQAHGTLAFGLLYFSILALAKFAMGGSATAERGAPSGSPSRTGDAHYERGKA